MAKGTSQAEAKSNSEKIKPIALAIVEHIKTFYPSPTKVV